MFEMGSSKLILNLIFSTNPSWLFHQKKAEIMGFQSEFYFVGFHFLLLFIIGPKSTWVSFALLIFFDKTCLLSVLLKFIYYIEVLFGSGKY